MRTEAAVCDVAFVGAGYMTAEHLKAFRDVPGTRLAGIYNRTPARADKLAQQFALAAVCSSIAELYEKTRAKLVVIAVPELSVRQVCEEAFRYPWTCLIEKPAGYDLTDAEAVAAAAGRSKRRAHVALNRRHYSSTRSALEDLADNPGPRFIYVQDQEDLIAARDSGQPQLVVKNWMYANSIHVIDYLTVFGRGPVREVERIVPWNPEDPRYVAAKILFDSGDIGIYQAVWNAPGPWAIAVTTPAKRWEMRPLEQAAFQLYGERKLVPVPTHSWDQEFKPGLRRQAEFAVRAALGYDTPELPTLEDALASMRLTRAIYEPA